MKQLEIVAANKNKTSMFWRCVSAERSGSQEGLTELKKKKSPLLGLSYVTVFTMIQDHEFSRHPKHFKASSDHRFATR